MITAYEIGPDGIWTGVSRQIAPEDGLEPSWTRTAIPTLAPGEYAQIDGYSWKIVTELPRPVLPDLTMRQFRLGLLNAGLLSGVEAAIEGLTEPDRSAAKIEFEYASVVVRTDPWVSSLAALMGLTDLEIDSLWTWASAL